MIKHLAAFRDLTQAFDPIYRPDGDGRGYVAEVHEGFRRQLSGTLALNDNVKLLIAGQPGCGKTTLLTSTVKALRQEGRFAALVNLERDTAMQDLGAAEMYLSVTAALLQAAEEQAKALSETALEACLQWIGTYIGKRIPRPATPKIIADELRRMLSSLKDSADLRRTLRTSVLEQEIADPFSLVEHVLADLKPSRPVVVLDGLDKLAPVSARSFFLQNDKQPMVDVPGAAIVTIPLSVVYEPTYNVLGERYNNADNAVLPAVRLWELDPDERRLKRSERGFEVLRQVVSARVGESAAAPLLDATIERAIECSAGNIRELARLIQASIVKAAVRDAEFIELMDIEAAVADQRESFRRAFQPKFLPVLQKVAEDHELLNTDDVGKLLLYGLWVIEYRNGFTWYTLPEPVKQLLDHLARKRS